jgi:hypothetical protein
MVEVLIIVYLLVWGAVIVAAHLRADRIERIMREKGLIDD